MNIKRESTYIIKLNEKELSFLNVLLQKANDTRSFWEGVVDKASEQSYWAFLNELSDKVEDFERAN